MIGAVEGGGTTFRVATVTLESDAVRVHESEAFPTSEPGPTLQRVREFFENNPVDRIGFACFGPLDVRRGVIGNTPKESWRNVDLRAALPGPVHIETDVNAAALAEARWGAGRDADPVVYVTVGTGVGGGLVVRGRSVHGAMHPEMGHLHSAHADAFEGVCPFHGNCIEGLASGPAVFARTGQDPASLSDDHPVWETVGAHLGELAASIALTVSAQRIVFGGSVSRRPAVLPAIRRQARTRLNGYLPDFESDPAKVVVLAASVEAGLWGAALVAARAG